jgi:glucose-6-phosphate dehydrogenase assembly protein OpcA
VDELTELFPLTKIEPHSVEKDLARLVRDAAQNDGRPISRACTLNLLVATPSTDALAQLGDTLRQQSLTHPNRTLLISGDPHAPDSELRVQAQGFAADRGGGNRRQLVCELVAIEAQGSSVGQVTGLVLTLLVPDLPVVLWWPGRAPFQSSLFDRLEQLVDRVLVDSGAFESPERDLVTLSGLRDKSFNIGDLNWARLTPWRELTAQFFDSRVLQPHLRRLDKVVIGFEQARGATPNRCQALLLAGWLASQLGWTPLDGGVSVEGDKVLLHLRRPAVGIGKNAIRLLTIEVRPAEPRDDALDGLASLSLLATDGVLASFVVERADDPNSARTRAEVGGAAPIERVARLERATTAQLIGDELRLLSQDRIYRAALDVAARFARDLA